MTTRERHMSIALVAFVIVFGVGFIGWQLILSPLAAKKDQIKSLDREIADREAREARIQSRRADLEKWKKLSLPPDKVDPAKVFEAVAPGKTPGENVRADLAQGKYWDWLNSTLNASGFTSDVAIIPKKPDAKNVPTLATKKPIYTRLLFTVQLKGDLASLVDFMDRFYKVRLLHQIRNLTIKKPLGADFRAAAANGGAAPAPTTDLDVDMTIEALVLDNAEKRTTLLPEKPVEMPSLLARTDAQYAMIPGKNVFFGPVSTGGSRDEDSSRSYVDASPWIRLTGITSGEYGLEASLWDWSHNWEYLISPRHTGGFQVTAEYTLGNRKRKDEERSGKTLALRDVNGKIKKEWLIVRIDPRDVILRDDEKGTYFSLHMGEFLAHSEELSKAKLEALGIKPEPARPKVKEIDYDDP